MFFDFFGFHGVESVKGVFDVEETVLFLREKKIRKCFGHRGLGLSMGLAYSWSHLGLVKSSRMTTRMSFSCSLCGAMV